MNRFRRGTVIVNVEITSEYVAVVRALVSGEDQTELAERLVARDGAVRSEHIFFALTVKAFERAAWRRFPNGYTDADVIRLVGHMRAKFIGFEVNPLVAEAILRAILGDKAATDNMFGSEMGDAMFLLLVELLEQQGITGDRMDDFFAEVVPIAQDWLASQESVSRFNQRVAESQSAG
jgi:hypothetical protein